MLTGHEIRDRIARRETSALEVAKRSIDAVAASEPELRAYLTLTPEYALARAAEIDARIARGEDCGTLAGVPVAIKDLFCTQGVRTTSGSKILANFVPPYSATVVAKLEAAGAVMIGKTNMDEFAMGSSCENSGFHPTRNPWDPSRVPGGSSGEPASFCNIVGVKPTYGRVSRYGMIAFASSLDQAGPMTADVRDAAIVLEAIAGHDPMDSTSVDVPVPHYADALREDLKGVKIGIVREFESSIGGDAAMSALYKEAYASLVRLGAELVEVSLPHAKYGLATYYLIAPAECSSNLARYDGARYGVRVDGDGDVYQMFERTRAAGFGPEVKRRIVLGTYALCSGYYDAYYVRAQKVRTLMKQDFDTAFAACDVIACPAVSCPPFALGAKSDPVAMYLMDYFTIPMSLAGIAAMSVPAGYVDGLPVGLQIAAPAFEEGRMLGVAHAYEQSTRFAWARAPKVGAA